MRRHLDLALTLACAGLVHCSTAASDDGSTSEAAVSQPARDWAAYPAVIDLATAPPDLYAVSDVHGSFTLFRTLLQANHLVDVNDVWTGGTAMLLVVGDIIDKGAESLEVIDLLRALEPQAEAAGGRVLTTLGNHEAEFFANPTNAKATSTGLDKEGVDNELEADGVTPKSVAKCDDAAGRGAWLATLPFAARVGSWFFVHAGNADTLSVPALEKSLEKAIDKQGYAGVTGSKSLLEAQNWYGSPKSGKAGQPQAAALGVEHIVFGHDPGALNDSGRIFASANGVLIKIDTAMGIHSGSSIGQPFFLHIHTGTTEQSVDVLDINGQSSAVP